MKQIGLYLFTGFLGAGKTTMLNHFLKAHASSKIGVVVNEFGKENIDAELIRQDADITINEINNGSIFCCCKTADFREALTRLSSLDLDTVIVEATGLADPSNLKDIFADVSRDTGGAYTYKGGYCLVDAAHFLRMYEAIPVMERQVACSNCVIINKCDLADAETRQRIKETLSALNPDALVLESSYGRIQLPDIQYDLKTPAPSQNTPGSRPRTDFITLDHGLSRQEADELIQSAAKQAYRAKGFVTIDGQRHYIDIVDGVHTVQPFPFPGEDKIVLLMTKNNVNDHDNDYNCHE